MAPQNIVWSHFVLVSLDVGWPFVGGSHSMLDGEGLLGRFLWLLAEPLPPPICRFPWAKAWGVYEISKYAELTELCDVFWGFRVGFWIRFLNMLWIALVLGSAWELVFEQFNFPGLSRGGRN